MRLIALLFVLLYVHLCTGFIKVRCSGDQILFRGRVDSIVSPGVVSGHVHKVHGGSNFGPALASQTPLQVYNDMIQSPCTTCSIGTVDLSAYWHPDLYYRWPNNSFSLVPKSGLLIYYLTRSGSGAQANPSWKAFPPGFRMVSGNPFRRNFDPNDVSHEAVSFACLGESPAPETHEFPTATRYCKNGLRLQVHFPQCWDGKNVDSANHRDHVAFPEGRPDGGNCPSTHPIRLPNLFFEAQYSVSSFPHGAAPNGDGVQRFVLANGDSTGYGFHGDFLNGWNQQVLQQVLTDPSCDAESTNNGNTVQNCLPLTQYVQDSDNCAINRKVYLTENLGLSNTIQTLPGCNPITGANQVVTPCSSPPSATEKAPATVRFHLKTEGGKFLSCPIANDSIPLTASLTNANALTMNEVFATKTFPGGYFSIQNDGVMNNFLSPNGPNNNNLMCNRGDASNWEAYQFIEQPNGKVAIVAKRNGKYLTVNPDGTISPTSTTVGTLQLFTRVVPTGGSLTGS